jgi:hypothetical protein
MSIRAAIERRLHIVQEAALKPSANFSALPSTIHRAAATGQLNAVITYIKQLGCTPNEYDASGIGPIHYAAEKGFIKYVLLKRKTVDYYWPMSLVITHFFGLLRCYTTSHIFAV